MRAPFARALRALTSRSLRTAQADQSIHAGVIAAAAGPVVEALEPRQLLSTYYVSTSGSDSAAGTSTTSAWKSINRVNSQTLKAGDKVLFQGGKTFYGSLYVPSREGGTSTAPVTFSTYGTGRATINSGSKAGIDVAQTAGIGISNLNFVGSGMSSNTWPGIWIHVDWADRKLSTINVKNVDVSGYGREGMKIMVAGARSSISDVRIEYSSFHDNLFGGMKVTGSAHNSNRNYVVDHVKAYNNPGSLNEGDVSGSGIFVADVDGARISRSIAYNNGKDGKAPVGIWTAGSNRVTIEYCESYNNRTRDISDGGGFDFDWDVHNSVMQYNYSHGNDGPGFLIYAGSHAASGNVIRYNVSENDGRKNGKAGIQLGGGVSNTQVYNNTVYIAGTGHSQSSAFQAHDFGSNGKVPTNITVRNNILYTTNGAKVVWLSSGVASKGSLKFNGNAYHATSSFKIQWGSYAYTSLSGWRTARGQEKLDGLATGYQGDPKLAAPGQGGTIGNADNLRYLSAYKLQSSSPLINKGVSQPTYLSSVGLDFYGDTLPKGGKYDVGIDEVA